MINFIENILSRFEFCFSRKSAFRQFIILTIGLMLYSDRLGITSVIRDPALRPDCYDSMLHFFRVSSWKLDSIRTCCFRTVKEHASLYKEGIFYVLIGGGGKQSKEGRRIPAVKKLFQESKNSAKPAYTFGHMFGGLGILAGGIYRWVCIPPFHPSP